MHNVLTFLTAAQDYFCFVAIVLWSAALVLRRRLTRVSTWRGDTWLGGTAVTGISVAVVEWAMFATPVTKTFLAAPHRVGDLVLGFALAAQPIGWLWLHVRRRWLAWGGAGFFIVVAGLRWDARQGGNILLAAATVALLPLVWRTARRTLGRTSLLIGALLPVSLPLDEWIGRARPWMEISEVSFGVALLSILAATMAVWALARDVRATWRAPTDVRHVEWNRFWAFAACWFTGGLLLATISGAHARSMFENSVLTRASLASSLLDPDVLADLLGPDMTLDGHHVWRRPSGQETIYAFARSHAVPASLPVRETLRQILETDPAITDVFITTVHDDQLVLCLAPHDPLETLTENPDHFAYVTLQRAVAARDQRLWEERKAHFEVSLHTTYNEVAVARAPIVHPERGMLGWLELNMPVSAWIAPQARVHLQAILVVVLGLGVLGLLGLQRYRSHEKEIADRAIEVEREAAEMKRLFIAKVSHELRTPLQSIVGFGEMLQRTALESDQHRYLSAILNQGGMLDRMVRDLLDLGAMEAGSLPLQEKPLELQETLREATESLRPLAEGKKIGLSFRSDGTNECWVWGDLHRVQQIVINLVSNAVKYTHEGRVEVWSSVHKDEEICEVALEVIDTGPGIPEAEQARLFTAFSRLTTAGDSEGAGLGLAIARELCVRMGGRIDVASNGHLGTTFTARFRLPRTRRPERGHPELSAKVESPQWATHRILIAEDNPFVGEVYREYLETLGARCDLVTDGREAVQAAARVSYTAILLDMHMPGLNGAEAAVAMRHNGMNHRTRIILASASAEPGDLPDGLFDHYIEKPVNLTRLAEAIVPRSLARRDAEVASEGVARLVTKFRVSFRAQVDTISAGLRLAVDRANYEDVRKLAHETKNSADVIGAPRLAQRLQTLQVAAERGRAAEVHAAYDAVCVELHHWVQSTLS